MVIVWQNAKEVAVGRACVFICLRMVCIHYHLRLVQPHLQSKSHTHTAASSFTVLNSLRKPFVVLRCRGDMPGLSEQRAEVQLSQSAGILISLSHCLWSNNACASPLSLVTAKDASQHFFFFWASTFYDSERASSLIFCSVIGLDSRKKWRFQAEDQIVNRVLLLISLG